MKKNIHFDVFNSEEAQDILKCFDESEFYVSKGKRNTLKNINYKGKAITIKAFKKPNFINSFIYSHLRDSKAKRSFEFAKKLSDLEIGTPKPLGYIEFKNLWGLTKSYYLCEYLSCDLTFRDLDISSDPEHTTILKAFTHFTYELHEKGVLFLDHSPGNTLIKNINGDYYFYLVDLNRMRFETLDLKTRISNFSRLTEKKEMIQIMSKEYANLSYDDYNNIFDMMWKETLAFRSKFNRKKRIKAKFKF